MNISRGSENGGRQAIRRLGKQLRGSGIRGGQRALRRPRQAAVGELAPDGPQYPVYELRARQDLGARLWEDPFAAVMREVGELCGLEPQEIIRHTTAGFKQTAKDQTLMLGVTLPGAHYRRSPRPGVDCAMPCWRRCTSPVTCRRTKSTSAIGCQTKPSRVRRRRSRFRAQTKSSPRRPENSNPPRGLRLPRQPGSHSSPLTADVLNPQLSVKTRRRCPLSSPGSSSIAETVTCWCSGSIRTNWRPGAPDGQPRIAALTAAARRRRQVRAHRTRGFDDSGGNGTGIQAGVIRRQSIQDSPVE